MSIQRVDESFPSRIPIHSVDVKGGSIVAKYALSAEVSEEDGAFVAEVRELGLLAHAEARVDLAEALYAEIAVVWERYALAPDNKLTVAAQNLKRGMLGAFESSTHAA